jgi:signal transduction histidine kinase/HAMP domain-containing protein
MKINRKLILSFLLISLVPLAVTSIFSYFNAEKALTQQVFNQLESVAAIQQSRVESIVDQNLERLVLVSSRTQLRLSLESFIRDPKSEDQDKMNRILLDARSSISGFKDISLLTPDGKIVASTDMTKIGTKHSNEEFFIRGQVENSVDIFFLDENQNLRAYLSGPLYLENKLLGVVVIESDVDNIISLVEDYSGLGETGETLLAKRDGNGDALFFMPLRFDQHAALRRAVSKDDLSTAITQALLKNEQLFTDTVDYRGQQVLATTRYIEKTDWGLVVKIDKAEAFAPINRLKNVLLTIGFLTVIAVTLLAFFSAKSISNPIQKLTESAEIIGKGNLDYKIDVKSKDEIGQLSHSFNEMTHKLKKSYAGLEEEITERKRAEEQILRQGTVLDAINKVFQETLRCETDEEVARTCLAVAEELTGSKFGWIGEVNESGRLDTIALSDPGWEACRMPKSDAVRVIKDMEIRGIWGRVLKDGRSLIVNDPASHPDRVGFPEGHPPLTSFLGVPLKRADRTFGMIALANREGGYNLADQQDIEALSVAFLEALIRTRAEEELRKHRDHLEEMVKKRTSELEEKTVELEQANIRLQEADRLKSVFLASMSHELRTPLNSIIGFTGIMLQGMAGELNEEQKKQLNIVYSSSKHLLSLINDLLDISKIEAGKVEVFPEEFHIGMVIDEVINTFGPAIQRKDLKLEKSVKDGKIYTDKRRFKQLLMNLLSNAVKFTQTGVIRISASVGKDAVEVSVKDTGIGIKKTDMSKLFQPFQQMELPQGMARKGTGLGLYLSKKIVTMLGGEIKAESRYKKGSIFIFKLPLKYKGVSDEKNPGSRGR